MSLPHILKARPVPNTTMAKQGGVNGRLGRLNPWLMALNGFMMFTAACKVSTSNPIQWEVLYSLWSTILPLETLRDRKIYGEFTLSLSKNYSILEQHYILLILQRVCHYSGPCTWHTIFLLIYRK